MTRVTVLLGNQNQAANDAYNLETHFLRMLYTINSGGLVTRMAAERIFLFLSLLVSANRISKKVVDFCEHRCEVNVLSFCTVVCLRDRVQKLDGPTTTTTVH